MNKQKLKVYNLYRDPDSPRGNHIVCATNMKNAAKLLGCSNYFLKEYSHVYRYNDLPSDPHKKEIMLKAFDNPGVVYSRNHYRDDYLPNDKKNNNKQAVNEGLSRFD